MRRVTIRRLASGYVGVRVQDEYGWTEPVCLTIDEALYRANKTRAEIRHAMEKGFTR